MSAEMLRVEFPPALMSRTLAAYYVGLSTRELDRLRDRGELIPVQQGKNIRWQKSELDAYAARLHEALKKDRAA